METDLYLNALGNGYFPKIASSSNERVSSNVIVRKNGESYLVFSRGFVEAFIEASKYAEVTDELNAFIERLNGITSDELDNLTEAQIDSMLYVDRRLADNPSIEEKRKDLREFTVDIHFLNSNAFWLGEGSGLGHYVTGDPEEVMIGEQAIYYKREGDLPFWLEGETEDLELSPPSNFDPRIHMEPRASEFVWVAAGTWEFIYVDGQWKLAILNPGT